MTANPSSAPAQGAIWEEEPAPRPTPAAEPGPAPAPRFKPINRQQMTWAAIDVDALIAPDHLARAIWELTGKLDWSRFCANIKAVEGHAGCSSYLPQLLASVWILAYSEGLSSPRKIAQRCQYDPAYRWLTGMEVINYHTLSDFRVDYKAEVDELFAQLLAILQAEGLIQLERVMQDGTKVKAAASADSFHREPTLQQHLEAARAQVAQLEVERQSGTGEGNARRQKARERAARERVQRMEHSYRELQQARTANAEAASQKDPAECRVSETEPEARNMKQPNHGGFAPSYNVQVMTDAAADLIVGVQVVQAANDQGQLEKGLQEVERQTGVVPPQVVVDGGYLSLPTVMEMNRRGVDLIAGDADQDETYHGRQTEKSMAQRGVAPEYYPQAFVYDAEQDLYRCPAGQPLHHRGIKEEKEGARRHQYRARAGTCQGCPHRPQCCPGQSPQGRTITRTEYAPEVTAFREKMKTPEAQAIYKERQRVAEFPNLWLKEKLGLRRFHVRGMAKVTCEVLWACLTYNIQQWCRLRWRVNLAATAAAA